jgi:hypothetical protein
MLVASQLMSRGQLMKPVACRKAFTLVMQPIQRDLRQQSPFLMSKVTIQATFNIFTIIKISIE